MEETPEPISAETLCHAARRMGHARVPEAVEELGPVARRGHHVAALAGPGSGVELLYALVAAERCDPDSPSLQALVLCPTPERAGRVARALHLLGAERGLEALAWRPWDAGNGAAEGERAAADLPFAQLLASRPGELLPEVEAGRLGLGDLRLVAVDGLAAVEAAGGGEALEALLDSLTGETQLLVADVARTARLDELCRLRLSRGRRWPPELFEPGRREDRKGAAGEAEGGGKGPFLLAATGVGEEGRLEALVRALRHAGREGGAERCAVRCPDQETAHRVAAALAAGGFALTDEAGEPGVMVVWGEEPPPEGVGVHFGPPDHLGELRGWLDRASVRIAVVEEEHRAQLRLLARRAGWNLRALPGAPLPSERDRIGRYRSLVRARLEEADDAPESLVLEPLLRDFGAGRVATALSGLLRETLARVGAAGRADAVGSAEGVVSRREGTPGERGERRRGGREEPAGPRPPGSPMPVGRIGEPARRRRHQEEPGSGWTRLFVDAGRRDDVGPGDLVGAITGETGAVGGQIGKIQIRDTHSLVDVDPAIAGAVIRKLTGASIKGREVTVREDRKS